MVSCIKSVGIELYNASNRFDAGVGAGIGSVFGFAASRYVCESNMFYSIAECTAHELWACERNLTISVSLLGLLSGLVLRNVAGKVAQYMNSRAQIQSETNSDKPLFDFSDFDLDGLSANLDKLNCNGTEARDFLDPETNSSASSNSGSDEETVYKSKRSSTSSSSNSDDS